MRYTMLPNLERQRRTSVLIASIVLVLIFLHIPAAAQTPHAVKLGAAQSFTLVNSGAWTEGSGRIEFRLQNVSQPSSDYYIFRQVSWAECRINANSLTLRCIDGQDSAPVSLDLTGRTDIRVRLTRDLTAQVFTMEVWDGAGGNRISGNFGIHGSPFTTTATGYLFSNFGVPSGGGELAFFRRYSTLVPINATPPAEAPDTAGDRGDFRFENSLADSGPAGLTLTLSGGGSAVYVNSPTYAPTAAIASSATARASFPIALDGSNSFSSLLGNGTPALFWQQLSGPAISPLMNRTVANSSFTPPLAGTYAIQLTATDALGRSSVASIRVGAVATDADGRVITDNPTLDRLLGPLTRSGTSPWPYYDIAEKALGDTIAAASLANPPALGAAFTGTVQITSAPGLLIGTGTLFTSEFVSNAGCGGNTQVIIAWNTVDGSGTGRHFDTIASVVDDTHATLCTYQNQIDLGSGLSFYRLPATTAHFQPSWWGIGAGNGTGNNWNYYDVCLSLYRLYYRTGLTKYLTQAGQFADIWWEWAIDHGRAGIPPRVAGLQGQFVRALDGHAERLPDLQTMANNYLPAGVLHVQFPHDLKGTAFDAREAGYATWYQALGALADTDSSRHATYCSNLRAIVPLWSTWQQPDGYWSEDLYSLSSGYVYKTPGASPWRTDIPIHGLQAAYDALIDTTDADCNNPILAATTLTAITDAVSWTYNAGRSDPLHGGNGGVYYDAAFETNGQLPLTVAGTVSVNVGSTSVTGVGTSFTSVFGSTGAKYIGFDSTRTIYKVINSANDTHLTITPAFGSQGEVSNLSGDNYAGASQASTACSSTAAFCWDGGIWPPFPPNGDRNLVRLMPGITGWLYNATGTARYKAWGDNWFSTAYGGPADGPGGLAACGGPRCDGQETDWIGALPSCALGNPVPCSRAGNFPENVYHFLGKNFGQGSGAPAAQTHLAYRLGGTVSEQNRTVYVDLPPTVFLLAIRVQLQVTAPSGAMTSTLCFASPCPVTVDARQGNHLVKIVYLSSSGKILAASDLTVLAVGLD
jgi:hypothetical protein